ncbi:TM2 domain-containing protein [Sphingomonas sp. MMS12-HWE2-04]|uniref:TM2 domain-containing protein n=1 Tax=Sphingomonas sp. MMS12-HWE2-04 TaxID=3234199 RepID=UPI00384E5DAF
MRGQVLGVDRGSGEGQISGEDGERYVFAPHDWRSERGPAVGVNVDFTVEGRRALCIFRLPEPGAVTTAPQVPTSDRNKYVAALLAFFFGVLGIHRFYLGRNGSGVVMLVLTITVVGMLVTWLWSMIDMVRYLAMSDREFAHRYARL